MTSVSTSDARTGGLARGAGSFRDTAAACQGLPQQRNFEHRRDLDLWSVVVRTDVRLCHEGLPYAEVAASRQTVAMQRAVVLTGGIGSGKSEVGRLLSSLGAHVVDADELARAVVEPGTPGHAAIREEFGPQVLADSGALDRAALADIAFGSPERLAALESIVHPLVEALAVSRLAAGSGAPVLVYEVPLLDRVPAFPEAAGSALVVVVDAPDVVRLERLRARGVSEEQITARMAAQPGRQEWLAAADRVVDNGGDRVHLEAQVESLWQELTASPEAQGRTDVT